MPLVSPITSKSQYPIDNICSKINQRLDELIPGSDTLTQAMRYSLLSNGKRIRPILTILTSEMLGTTLAFALDAACAIEMVHTYSLIHDDLPCMDNDDFRRGKPSLHRAFPEAIALLAGDALLTEAFKVIAESKSLSDTQIARLISILSKRVGKDGMVGGQVIDMLSEDLEISEELFIEMDQKKTGELFSCSLEFGAILSNASNPIQENLRQVGLYFGLAYQIQDDLLDLNKATEKKSLVYLLGTKKAQDLLTRSLQSIHQHLLILPSERQILRSYIDLQFEH